MKSSITILIVSLMFFITSCKSQMVGIFGGESESGLKHLSYSTLELTENNTFKLIYSTTSLESTVPSTRINEVEGKFEKDVDRLVLFPETERVNWLSYGKNPDSLNFSPVGVRRTAIVVIDTFYGQWQILEGAEAIIFAITAKPNSKYLWNEHSCFVKFDNSDDSKDLKNYCSEIKMEK